MLQVTPRMANAGVAKLKELGYENVEFVDPQLVFMAMLEKAPLSLSRAIEIAAHEQWESDTFCDEKA